MILNRNMLGKNLTKLTTASCLSQFEEELLHFLFSLSKTKQQQQQNLELIVDLVIQFLFRSQHNLCETSEGGHVV